MEEKKRHRLLWKAGRPIVRAAAKLIFNFDTEVCREDGPLLILPNHNAELDPMFVACAFPEPVYFVASEHLLRKGRASALLRWSTRIVPRQKGGSGASTVRGIVRQLQEGSNVCLYPEGNRSWDGVTRPITPATGKLARMSGAKLVTYRTEGVYFSNPRWSGGSLRRGRTCGRIMGVYEPEYLRSLTAGAVQELIERDLFEDAYARQREKPVRFRGRRLAEHLETLLFICPHCGAEGRMRSEGDHFYCDGCGTKLRYTQEGFFVGENCIFDTVLDWNIWQSKCIGKKCAAAGDAAIFEDGDMDLYIIHSAESSELAARGRLALYRDRIELPDGSAVGTNELTGMAIMGPQDLYFSVKNKNYLVKTNRLCCTLKYLTACKVFDKSLQYGI